MRRNRSGFTLIELLIVVLVIGILASVAVPKFTNTKEKALLATMKADLRNLASAQEAYLYDFSLYYSGAVPTPELDFRASAGVAVTLQNVSSSGWAATAVHTGSMRTCALFVGNAAAAAPADTEGQPKCS